MKYLTIITMIVLSILLVGCTASNIPTGAATTDFNDADLSQANLEIEGMTCQSCSLGVEYQLKQVEGVKDAKVDWAKGTGVVTYDPSKVEPEEIAKASTSYPAKIVE